MFHSTYVPNTIQPLSEFLYFIAHTYQTQFILLKYLCFAAYMYETQSSFLNICVSQNTCTKHHNMNECTNWDSYLCPSSNHSQFFHGWSTLIIEGCFWFARNRTQLGQRGDQELVNSAQVVVISCHSTSDPFTAYLCRFTTIGFSKHTRTCTIL